MVEASNVKALKPIPQVVNNLNNYRNRMSNLNEAIGENAQRLFGQSFSQPEIASQDRAEANCEVEALQIAMSELDDAIIDLENKISAFMQEI